MILIYFECDTCGEEFEVQLREASALKLQPIPKGWIWKEDQGYCPQCRHYSGVTIGEV